MNKTNTSSLQNSSVGLDYTSITPQSAIYIDHVSMVFNMASQQLNSLKEYAIAFMRRELMFKEFVALDDITFNVEKGDVFGILGTNGSGKSTLLKIIAGVLEPTKGHVQVNGSIAPLIELGAGFDHELTARENIYLNGALLGYSRQFIEEHFDDIVDFAEIGDFLDTPLKNYSSGMIARIAFAIATVIVPEILIVDEVLSVGDFMFQQKCEKMIQTLINEHNVTVLIVSHNNEQIERLCNKAVWIEKGHMRLLGSAKNVCRIYSALGGHSGSDESESIIFELLSNRIDYIGAPYTSIASNTKYGNTAKLISACTFSNTDDLVLVPGDSPFTQLLGMELSSVLGCPIMTLRADIVTDEIELALQRLGKRNPIVLMIDGELSNEVIDVINALYKDSDQSAFIVAKDYSELSVLVRQYLDDRSDNLAYNVNENAEPAASLSSYIMEAPLRYANKTITVYSSEHPFTQQESQSLINNAFDSENAPGLALFKMPSSTQARHDSHPSRGVVIANDTSGLYDAISAIPYASQQRLDLMLLDHNNLDNMVGAINELQRYPNDIQIVFLGGKWCFSETDKEIISKALS